MSDEPGRITIEARAVRPPGYDPGSTTVATESFAIFVNHLTLTATERLTLEGTARVAIV